MTTTPRQSFINFEFRFDRDIQKHSAVLSDRKALAEKFAHQYQLRTPEEYTITHADLYPVERAGKSGSEVFYLDLHVQSLAFPRRFVAKFQNLKKTKREHLHAFQASWSQLCNSVEKFESDNSDLGMIICDLAKIGNHCEFRGYFLNSENSSSQCAEALRSAFKVVGERPHISQEDGEPPKSFVEDFKRYVDRPNNPIGRIESLRNASDEHPSIIALADSVILNFERVNRELNFTVTPYLVHGDLHARNLMVNAQDPSRTELIDFGWVHFGHPAKDFVLMEATLKFMLLHELLTKLTKEKKVSLHLNVRTYENLENFLCLHGLDLPDVDDLKTGMSGFTSLTFEQQDVIIRTYVCLSEVRSAAKKVLEEYCAKYVNHSHNSPQQHYFASLFLVVLGLSSMDEMERIWTLVGLTKIGERIWIS